MFDALLKSKFYSKCKSVIKLTKTRIEIIKRKRKAMQKFLRNDIADLLKNGLDSNAYGRVEGLHVEQNLSSCYEFVEQSCLLILSHLSAMDKQRESPEECREAIPSLMFAAARFADLPELRELRSLFAVRYGNYLEPYVNREFVKKLKADPPTKEMKLQMMQEIALESGIEWDSKALQQKLYQPPSLVQAQYANERNNESLKTHHQNGLETNIEETEDKHSNNRTEVAKKDHTVGNGLAYKSRVEVEKKEEIHKDQALGNGLPYKSRAEFEKKKEEKPGHGRASSYWSSNSSSCSESTTNPEDSTGSDDIASEDIIEGRKLFGFRSMAPPYIKTDSIKKATSSDMSSESGREEEAAGSRCKNDDLQRQEESANSANPVPRSMRVRRPLKPVLGSHGNSEVSKPSPKFSNGENRDHDHRDEEKKMDKLLSPHSRKPSKLPSDSSMQNNGCREVRAPTRVGSLPTESLATPAATDERKGLARAATYQPDSTLSPLGHVHPKLPDYDDFVARLAALRASS